MPVLYPVMDMASRTAILIFYPKRDLFASPSVFLLGFACLRFPLKLYAVSKAFISNNSTTRTLNRRVGLVLVRWRLPRWTISSRIAQRHRLSTRSPCCAYVFAFFSSTDDHGACY